MGWIFPEVYFQYIYNIVLVCLSSYFFLDHDCALKFHFICLVEFWLITQLTDLLVGWLRKEALGLEQPSFEFRLSNLIAE